LSDLQKEIEGLSATEKFELIEALWESLEAQPGLTDEPRSELDARLARYESNRAAVIPWEQVKAKLLNHPCGRRVR
jgi:putative addiction module component (TIGR02574 family)